MSIGPIEEGFPSHPLSRYQPLGRLLPKTSPPFPAPNPEVFFVPPASQARSLLSNTFSAGIKGVTVIWLGAPPSFFLVLQSSTSLALQSILADRFRFSPLGCLTDPDRTPITRNRLFFFFLKKRTPILCVLRSVLTRVLISVPPQAMSLPSQEFFCFCTDSSPFIILNGHFFFVFG